MITKALYGPSCFLPRQQSLAVEGLVFERGKMMDDSFGHWLAGFTDGEGHFGIYENGNGKKTLPRAEFRIKLRQDDEPILKLIQKNLGVGKIYPARYKQHHNQAAYTVTRRRDLLRIIQLFDKYPLKSKKQQDYAIWRQAVVELNKPIPPKKEHLLTLADQLRDVRKFNCPLTPTESCGIILQKHRKDIMDNELEHLSIRIPGPLKQQLKIKAAEMNLNMSKLAVEAIDYYLSWLEMKELNVRLEDMGHFVQGD